MPSASEVIAYLRDIKKECFKNEGERAAVRDALFDTYRNVQTPWDVMTDSCWNEPTTFAAVKTFVDLDIWNKWAARGFQTASSRELADLGPADHSMIARLLRMLACHHYVEEVGMNMYAPTELSRAFTTPSYPSVIKFFYEMQAPGIANWPKFAHDTKYQNPTNPAETNFTHWLNGTGFFGLLGQRPELGKAFDDTMMGYSASKTPWVDIYPTDTIIANLKPDTPLVVDIGGSIGHDLEKFRVKHADKNLPEGSLILQDLPHVIEHAIVQKPAVAHGHDMFTPQPVKGAYVYYLHIILHDWPDVQAVTVLKNIGAVLTQGYSRILLHETVIPSKNVPIRQAMSDLAMMMCFSAIERTEEHWHKLVDQAGLKISKIHTVPQDVESIIEIELP